MAFMKVFQFHRRACPPNLQGRRAFTLPEMVLVVAILVVLAMLLPALMARYPHVSRANCVNCLKEIGIAFRVWGGDNDGKYPMEVPAAQGGARELIATGNVAGCFRVMSNELSAPKILTCPEDSKHKPATNWAISRLNLSYFIGMNATNPSSPTVLSGDANLLQNGRAVSAGKLNLWLNSISWTKDRHGGGGNILLPDGSVQSVRQLGFTNLNGAYFATNRVVVP
jgi:prepilin-type N-terminal cleavage/methylation domain-containing protein/prepilin-type processing-associated H-X9-DG protein